ncbi:DUF2244 domain-containing protein [Prosthecodimorpha staleyi]|uniref:DUF2244 domain-containing protein n=1 Tax=Prosthecodimorpha staleyi TaxID=2840188 RepID=A0A947D3I9_9HYPH|nr:DUF2244 domain-containing protein [Prosthecodimorpha staleyi]MBT9289643.1 DUF2244 domain-containing protein [Prosthecodimorpha staleyi]
MTDSNAALAETPFFSAVLLPHRSLGPRGFLILMGAVALVSFAVGLLFYRIGAWPVSGFLGLDAGLVWFAFRLNYRAARAREEVSVSPHEVVVRRIAAHGPVSEYRFNPLWVRLDVEEVEDEGVTRIALRSHGRSLAIGGFLNPDDRTSFAEAFRRALAAARSGRPGDLLAARAAE